MKNKQSNLCPPRPARGFTFLEFTVALVVLGVVFAGLFPLLAITSRGLQPIKVNSTFDCRTPARDWGKNSSDPGYNDQSQQNQRHPWYVTPYDDPWLRKLGSGAQVTSGTVTASSLVPVQSSVVFLDDYEPGGVLISNSTDGTGTFLASGWTYVGGSAAYAGDQHRKLAAAAGGSSTGSASWSLTAITAGWYSIQATWTGSADQVTDAQFSYSINGGVWVQAAPVGQDQPPIGVTDSASPSHSWHSLTSGLIHLNANDAVQVKLSDVRASSTETGKYVCADAVRIVQNDVTVTSVTRSFGVKNPDGTAQPDVTANVSVTVNISQ